MCVLTRHVDDFLWASIGKGGTIIDRLLKKFEFGRRESGRLRFCGKQFDKSGNDVLIDVIDNTNKITYIDPVMTMVVNVIYVVPLLLGPLSVSDSFAVLVKSPTSFITSFCDFGAQAFYPKLWLWMQLQHQVETVSAR